MSSEFHEYPRRVFLPLTTVVVFLFFFSKKNCDNYKFSPNVSAAPPSTGAKKGCSLDELEAPWYFEAWPVKCRRDRHAKRAFFLTEGGFPINRWTDRWVGR